MKFSRCFTMSPEGLNFAERLSDLGLSRGLLMIVFFILPWSKTASGTEALEHAVCQYWQKENYFFIQTTDPSLI